MFKRFFGPDGRPEKQQFGRGAEGTGSGFVYDDKGHILTNNHVVAGSGKITVTFHDGVEATATVVGTDPESDVAVIKVDNTSYRPLPKGSSRQAAGRRADHGRGLALRPEPVGDHGHHLGDRAERRRDQQV